MTANEKAMKRVRTPGTVEGRLPGESLDDFEKRVGDDIPEATDEDFARALGVDDVRIGSGVDQLDRGGNRLAERRVELLDGSRAAIADDVAAHTSGPPEC